MIKTLLIYFFVCSWLTSCEFRNDSIRKMENTDFQQVKINPIDSITVCFLNPEDHTFVKLTCGLLQNVTVNSNLFITRKTIYFNNLAEKVNILESFIEIEESGEDIVGMVFFHQKNYPIKTCITRKYNFMQSDKVYSNEKLHFIAKRAR